ncbi:MAG: hypothetical protein AAFR38_06300 [Planctomycetota bacterium]
MALFAAAAELLSGAAPEPVGAAGEPAAASTPGDATRPPWLEPALRAVVASSRGWNKDAARRLAMIAALKGRSPSQLASDIRARGVVEPEARPATSPDPRSPTLTSSPETPSDEGQTRGGGSNAPSGLLAMVALVAIISVVGGLVWGVLGTSSPATEPRIDGDGSSGATDRVASRSDARDRDADARPSVALPPPPPSNDRDLRQPEALLAELRGALRDIEISPADAADRFERAAVSLMAHWDEFEPPARRQMHATIIAFLFAAAPNRELASSVVATLAEPLESLGGPQLPRPAELATIVWSAGFGTRALSEPELPVTLALVLDPGLSVAGGGFDSGAVAGIRTIAEQLARLGAGPAHWRRWADLVGAITAGQPSLRDALVQRGIERMLLGTADTQSDPDARSTVSLLAERLDWSSGGGSRRWLLALLLDPGFDSADLNALTAAIVGRTSASGVDPSMILPPSAGDDERAGLRARYAAAWGIEADAERREVLATLRAEFNRPLEAERFDSMTDAEAIADAASFARGSAAAALLWRGRDDESKTIAENAREPIENLLSQSQRRVEQNVPSGAVGDASWARRYLELGRAAGPRIDLIIELGNTRGPLGTVNAEVLVAEALRGSPSEVRDEARRLIELVGPDDTFLLNAALEQFDQTPRSPVAVSLFRYLADLDASALPGPRTDAWEIAIRRALSGRLLARLAAGGPLGAVDALADQLADAYEIALRGGGSAAPRGADSLEGLIADARSAWPVVSGAEAAGGGSPEGRLAARLRIARGPIQRVLAHQLALVETAAAAVRAERPAAESAIDRAVADLERSLLDADRVTIQIRQAEAARLRVWLARLEGVLR